MDSYAEALAHQANQRLAQSGRDDIEWAVNGGSIYIRDKLHMSARRTRELDAKAESDRQRWKHRQPRDDGEPRR